MSRFQIRAIARFVLALLPCLLLCGCSEKTHFSLHGTVTYKGKPVPVGEVQMMPDSTKGNKGPSVMAPIKDGAYQTPEGRGLVGGAYTLMITGYEKAMESDDPTAADFGPPLFERTVQHATFPNEDSEYDIVVE